MGRLHGDCITAASGVIVKGPVISTIFEVQRNAVIDGVGGMNALVANQFDKGRFSPLFRIEVRAQRTGQQAQSIDQRKSPPGIRVAEIEPAYGTRADATQDLALVPGGLQKINNTKLAPDRQHRTGVTTGDVNDVSLLEHR